MTRVAFTFAVTVAVILARAALGAPPPRASAVSWTLHTDNHIAPDREYFQRLATLPDSPLAGITSERIHVPNSVDEFEESVRKAASEAPEVFIHLSSHGDAGAICQGNYRTIPYSEIASRVLRAVGGRSGVTVNFILSACYSGSFIPKMKDALYDLPEQKRPAVQILTSAPADAVSHGDHHVGSFLLQAMERGGRWVNAIERVSPHFCTKCTPFQKIAKLLGTYSLNQDLPQVWSYPNLIHKWSQADWVGVLASREFAIEGAEPILEQAEEHLVDRAVMEGTKQLEIMSRSANPKIREASARALKKARMDIRIHDAWVNNDDAVRKLYGPLNETAAPGSELNELRQRFARFFYRRNPDPYWDLLIHAGMHEGYQEPNQFARLYNVIRTAPELSRDQIRFFLDLPTVYKDSGSNYKVLLQMRQAPEDQKQIIEWIADRLAKAKAPEDRDLALDLYNTLRFRRFGAPTEWTALLDRIERDEFPIVFDSVIHHLETSPGAFLYNSPQELIGNFKVEKSRMDEALRRLAEREGYVKACPALFEGLK